jgi:hypothetical protein
MDASRNVGERGKLLSLPFSFFLFLFGNETFQRVAATDGRRKFLRFSQGVINRRTWPPMRAAQTSASMVSHPSCSLDAMKHILREHREIA